MCECEIRCMAQGARPAETRRMMLYAVDFVDIRAYVFHVKGMQGNFLHAYRSAWRSTTPQREASNSCSQLSHDVTCHVLRISQQTPEAVKVRNMPMFLPAPQCCMHMMAGIITALCTVSKLHMRSAVLVEML